MACGFHCECVGKLVYIFEKLSACCALSAIMTCIVVILMVSITIGAGVGYNYCSIDTKTEEANKMRLAEEEEQKMPRIIPETWIPPVTSRLPFGQGPGAGSITVARRRQRRTRIRLVVLERDLPHPDNLLLVGLYQKYGPFDPLEHYGSTRRPLDKIDWMRSYTVKDGVVPVFAHKNMSPLLNKILSRHKNVTIQFYKTY